MARLALAIVGVLFLSVSAFGAPVSVERAYDVARNHLERAGRGGKIKSARRPPAGEFANAAAPDAPRFFVEKEGGGFIIVSGDDIAAPILGEVDNGNIDTENMPPALLWLLGTYEKQIEDALKGGETQDADTRRRWEQTAQMPVSFAAAPYPATLLTTAWDQREPYNLQCPLDGTQRSAAGCVAIAMAQIMKYWQHPAYGTGASEAYTANSAEIYVPSVDFNTRYDYANMLDSYTASGGTAVQRDAVSK